jgi:hypothetical protein
MIYLLWVIGLAASVGLTVFLMEKFEKKQGK